MTQEEKQLLLQDLCTRLPYGVILQVGIFDNGDIKYHNKKLDYKLLSLIELDGRYYSNGLLCKYHQFTAKPYLRPMSSMTDEEKRHVSKMICLKTYDNGVVYDIPYDVYTPYYVMEDCLNYLRSIHVDYSGLIEKGLAIKAPEGIYNN